MQILFMCTGNTCRSPMAEYLLKKLLAEDGEDMRHYNIRSAGVYAVDGSGASKKTRLVLEHITPEIGNHRSRNVLLEELERSDLILTMTELQKVGLHFQDPNLQVFTLKEFASYPKNEWDIADPYGLDREAYERTCMEILQALRRILPELKKMAQEKRDGKLV